MLYVCSVHLDADKVMDRKSRVYHQEQRQNQLISLLKRLSNHCRLDNVDMEDASILIAGDFNMLRNNDLLSSIEQGTIHPTHNIPLRDAYLEAERCNRQPFHLYQCADDRQEVRLVKTFRGGAVLDYVLVSEPIRVLNTLLMHPMASVAGMEKWPCIDHPSDHLPVGIDIEWNGR
jgi:endonuclease/exonuclease/phosphatase family metal-dependent hydrolase